MSSGGGVLALEIQRLGKSLEPHARLDLGDGQLERPASGCRVASTQGREPSSIRRELTSR